MVDVLAAEKFTGVPAHTGFGEAVTIFAIGPSTKQMFCLMVLLQPLGPLITTVI
jgi:hypothetical protein